MGLINVPNINNLDAATPELFNSRFGAIADLLNGNIDTNNLAAGAVTAADLASDAVTTGKVLDGAVTPVKQSNPYKFAAYKSGTFTPGTGATVVVFNNEDYDTNGNYDTATGIYTAPVSGYYHFDAHMHTNVIGATRRCLITFSKNGVEYALGGENTRSDNYIAMPFSIDMYLLAGETVNVNVFNSAGQDYDTTAHKCRFSGHLYSIT